MTSNSPICQELNQIDVFGEEIDLEKIREELAQVDDQFIVKHEDIKSRFVRQIDRKWQGIPLYNEDGNLTSHGINLVKYGNKPIATKYIKEMPYVDSLVNRLGNLSTVRFLRLKVGGIIPEHTDGDVFAFENKKLLRFHIPIYTNKKVDFVLAERNYKMKEGCLYYTDISKPHFVKNLGNEDRIHLVIDVYSSESLRNLIRQGVRAPMA